MEIVHDNSYYLNRFDKFLEGLKNVEDGHDFVNLCKQYNYRLMDKDEVKL